VREGVPEPRNSRHQVISLVLLLRARLLFKYPSLPHGSVLHVINTVQCSAEPHQDTNQSVRVLLHGEMRMRMMGRGCESEVTHCRSV
jgi:hypothetical protein